MKWQTIAIKLVLGGLLLLTIKHGLLLLRFGEIMPIIIQAVIICVLAFFLIKTPKISSRKIKVKNERTGVTRESKIGFSWTALFFGCLVPLLRSDYKWFFASLIISLVTVGFFWLVFPFIYNKIYIKELLGNGFTPISDEDKNILIKKGWLTS